MHLKMATYDNETSEPDTFIDDYIKLNKVSVVWSFSIGCIIMLALSLIWGSICWIQIGPWRKFKNFVFLNVTLCLFMMNIARAGCFMNSTCCGYAMLVLLKVSMCAFANWVLIMYMAIYTKMLQVFSGDLEHKRIKANAFAWGMMLIECGFPMQQAEVASRTPNAMLCVVHSVTFVIIGFYLSILYALLKLITRRMVSVENNAQIIKIFMYVTGAFGVLILMQAMYYLPALYDYIYIGIGVCEVILVLSYWSMKSHREIWDNYMTGKTDVTYQDEIRASMSHKIVECQNVTAVTG